MPRSSANLTYNALNAAGRRRLPDHRRHLRASSTRPSPTPAIGNALKGWINYLLTDGQDLAAGVDFAPLPASLQQQALAQLDQITDRLSVDPTSG